MISVILFTCKMGKHSDFYLGLFQIVDAWWDFTVVIKLTENFKSLYGFGGRCLKIRDVCVDFEPYFKVHNLVSVHPKSIILGQMTNLNMTFHVMVSVYRFVKIWNSPQFPAEFRNGQLDGRTLDIIHCFYNIARHFSRSKVEMSPTMTSAWTISMSHPFLFHKILANQSAC